MTDRTLRVAIEAAAPVPLSAAFACGPGEVLGIFGPSGSGKTTILRTIAGLHPSVQGRVAAGAEVWMDTAAGVNLPPHRRRVGFMFQDYALFPHLTAFGNVMTALRGLRRHERRRRAEELLGAVGLADRRDRRPASLSGGERQRVALARALARDPAVLLLDEPFAAVDRGVRRRLQDRIDEIRTALDIPVVLVTHDFDDVVRLATHLLVLGGGRSLGTGSLREMTSRLGLTALGEAVGFGAVVDTRVAAVDRRGGLADLVFGGGTLQAPDDRLEPGMHVRVRIPARDVILAIRPVEGLSLHNVLDATVAAIDAGANGSVLVQLAVGPERLLAEITRDAVERLGITPGLRLHALVKSMALEVFPGSSLGRR